MISGSRVFKAATQVNCYKGMVLTLDRDDELGDDGEHLGTALFQHVESTLEREESVRVSLLSDTFEEDGEVMVVVKLSHIHFPVDSVVAAMLNSDGEVSAVVEAAELGRCYQSLLGGSSLRLRDANFESADELG